MLEEYDDIMSSQDVCEALKIGTNALYELLNSGKLKAYRVGNRVWKIPKLAVIEYILSNAGLKT